MTPKVILWAAGKAKHWAEPTVTWSETNWAASRSKALPWAFPWERRSEPSLAKRSEYHSELLWETLREAQKGQSLV